MLNVRGEPRNANKVKRTRAEHLVRDVRTIRRLDVLRVRNQQAQYDAASLAGIVAASRGSSRMTGYAARVIPWIVLAVVVVPLVIAGFVATRRSTVAREHPASEDAQARARTEQEFAEAEAYEEKWREKDKERYRQERFP